MKKQKLTKKEQHKIVIKENLAEINESLKYLYVPCVFVNMKSGGLSTKNIFSKFIIQNELLRACQNNNIPTNHFKLLVRFFYKLFK